MSWAIAQRIPSTLQAATATPGSRAADEDSLLGVALDQRAGDGQRAVGVVVGRDRIVGAEVDRLVAALAEGVERDLPQRHAGVVEGAGDPHRASSARARSAIAVGVIPKCSATSAKGAEAPKWSRPTASPPSPTQRTQPSVEPNSTDIRFVTAGGRTSSR